MQIGILTTETSHHIYFVKLLVESFENISVICENSKEYDIDKNSFKYKVEQYERKKWFNDENAAFSDFSKVYYVDNINDEFSAEIISKNNYDVVIDFGTRVLKLHTLQACPKNIFNLHGGDPERYRGLDSHLWSIYHNDFQSLVTTIHRLDLELDAGDIVTKATIPLVRGAKLHELRSLNTEVCVDLAKNLLEDINRNKKIYTYKQHKVGRYYSAMPTELLATIESKFQKYTIGI